uniref:Uncharacterized protein n=1 Tax=Hucho hucho TaxID=62062 RepID=A0A4W5RJG3_9TELE
KGTFALSQKFGWCVKPEEVDIDLEASETKEASLAIQNKFRHFQMKKYQREKALCRRKWYVNEKQKD